MRRQNKSIRPTDELVCNGQQEATRLERDVIPQMHKKLRPLAKEIIKIGLDVKAALGKLRELKAQYWEEYEAKREQAAMDFHKVMDQLEEDLKNDHPYTQGTIQTAFGNFQQIARQNEGIEARVDESEIAQRLDGLMEEKYRDAVIALDDEAQKINEDRAPWELRYFATSEMDDATGKLTLAVSIGSEYSNSSLDDQCALCGKIIPANEDRVRSFESSSRKAVMSSECYEMVCRAESIVRGATNPDDSNLELAKQELLEVWPYKDHMLVTEHDSLFGLRREAMGLADHRTPEEKKSTTMRKLLPRFLHMAYRTRPLFGVPQEEISKVSDEVSSINENGHQYRLAKIPYQWFTYQEVWQVVCRLAKEMIPVLLPVQKLHDAKGKSPSLGPEVAILSSPSPIFFALQMACITLGRISVAMDTSWNVNDVWTALENSKVSTLLLDPQGAQMLTLTNRSLLEWLPPCIKKVIVVASDPFQRNKTIDEIVHSSNGDASIEILMAGASKWWKQGDTCKLAMETVETFTRENQALPTDEYLFGLFSSGTSGSGGHKGVLVRESTFRQSNTTANFDHPIVGCLKSSPSWASGNDIVWQTMLAGGRVGFATARSKSSSLWCHLYSIKPTWRLSFVPALMTELVEEYLLAFEFFRQSNTQPTHGQKTKERLQNWARAKAAEYLYSCLGGSLEVISVGGAMVNQAHVDFLSRILPCEIYQGYGSTEGGGIAIAGHNDNELIPFHRMDFRVESRPSLGYTMEDKPFPRGELLILGKDTASAAEWFGEEQTVQDQRRKYSDDGYYSTGDIVEYHPDANSFRIIDRVSALVKLPDGVFFSPHRVETTIGDLTLHGVSGYLVTATAQGTVVLVLESVPQIAGSSTGYHGILLQVQSRCRESNIDERCIPRRLIVDDGNDQNLDSLDERLWKATGCYTVSGKLIRQRVCDRVKHLLAKADEMNEVDPVASSMGAANAEQDTALALIDAIGIPRDSRDDAAVDMTLLTLETLGVTSLLWVKLRSVVRQSLAQRGHAGAKLPFFGLGEKSMMDVARWMTGVVNKSGRQQGSANGASGSRILTPERERSGEKKYEAVKHPALPGVRKSEETNVDTDSKNSDAPTLTSSHPVGISDQELAKRTEFKDHAHNVDKLESELFRLVDAEILHPLKRCQNMGSTYSSESQRVFLTGATGFLGRHILRSLLLKGAEVICLTRGKSIQDARSRVVSGLSSIGLNDESLLTRLNIQKGDIALENFGLDQETYDMLAYNTDTIVHAAALVKMWSLDTALGDAYEMLYANTQSCVSIARLSAYAMQFGHPSIPIVYTSSKSVENGLSEGTTVQEVGLYYSSSTMRRQPYAISKLLGETVLMHGSRKYKNSLCIMRPPLLTFSSDGDSNDSDWFVRLLLTVMDLGLAPGQGPTKFLSKQTVVDPVDMYANKVVKEVFKQLEDRKSGSTSAVKWADAFGDGSLPKLRIQDILSHLEGEVESVPAYAFRSAVLFSDRPLPFLPLVDTLVDYRGTRFEDDNDPIDEPATTGQIPPLLSEGLLAFFKKRCPSITIKPNL